MEIWCSMVAQKINQSHVNLVNFEKFKFYIIWIEFGKNVWEFIFLFLRVIPSSTFVTSKNQNSVYMVASLITFILKKNSPKSVNQFKSYRVSRKKMSFFNHRVSSSKKASVAEKPGKTGGSWYPKLKENMSKIRLSGNRPSSFTWKIYF